MFDINLFPINLESGVEQGSLPGLIALTPPRRSARGRENDKLIALVSISGATGINNTSLNAWLSKKAEIFYSTAGTVTFAVKTLVDSLNSDLLERNLKKARDGSRMMAALNLIVLKRESLYLVNIGPARAFFASSTESVEFSDPETQGRGLGIDQMLTCRFSQREVKENDVLVLSCQPPEVWKAETFAGCTSLATEAVSRRLFSQVGGDLKAVLIRFKPGRGTIAVSTFTSRPSVLPRVEKSIESPSPVPAAANPVDAVQVNPIGVEGILPITSANHETHMTQSIPVGAAEPSDQAILQSENQNAHTPSQKEVPSQTTESQLSEVQVKAGKLIRQVVTGVKDARSTITRFLRKILPGITDEPLKLSRQALIGIAIGVPLVIVLLAAMVYMRSGASKLFEQNLVMAQQYAMQAEVQLNDPPLRLASLQQSIFWLDKAEAYGQSEASSALRVKVQTDLDVLQGVQRLEMVEVVPGGLPSGTNITQIVATSTDVYFLDEDSGKVKRYYMGSSGYLEDEKFRCGPDPDDSLNMIGNLVDIIPINVNNTFKATLMAIDASGNTEFCIPGNAGVIGSLTQPDQGWKQLKSISIFNNYLYVLDIGGNAVYRYEGNGIQYETKPTLFFDNQIPILTEAIDIEVNGDELYILRSNGQMVECTYSHMKDYKLTECIDPAPYGDMRTGQVPEAINFPEANFIQMRLTAAPDSSIYLLDATSKALYHFSLQRNLQKILHPRPMEGTNLDRISPTAMAISSGRIAFIAYGSLIYYSPLP